jgi:hypothetical protein
VLARDSVSYEQAYFTYMRPVVKDEGILEVYLLRVVLRSQDRTVEASGPPFVVRTESYFDELDFAAKSFWYKDQYIPKQLWWATLYVRDKYAIMTRAPPSLFVVESPEYQIKSVLARPDGTYRLSYISAKTAVEFKYNLDGTSVTEKSLPSMARPLWSLIESRSHLSLLRADGERMVARYTSKQPIQIDDFSATMYQADTSTDVFCTSTKVTVDPDRANTICVWATMDKKGTFNLGPAYCGLPLTSDAKSHSIQIVVKFDSYLFNQGDEKLLTCSECTWASNPDNARTYVDRCRVGAPRGYPRIKSSFSFLPNVPFTPTDWLLDFWPTKLTFTISPVDSEFSGDNGGEQASRLPADNEADWRLSRLSILCTSTTTPPTTRILTYGQYPDTSSKDVSVSLLPHVRITRARVVTLPEKA